MSAGEGPRRMTCVWSPREFSAGTTGGASVNGRGLEVLPMGDIGTLGCCAPWLPRGDDALAAGAVRAAAAGVGLPAEFHGDMEGAVLAAAGCQAMFSFADAVAPMAYRAARAKGDSDVRKDDGLVVRLIV